LVEKNLSILKKLVKKKEICENEKGRSVTKRPYDIIY
jgi:hypothetical protein